MPSFLGRLLGLSFRTELLIMNLVGLVNSTLDWSPLKWTNKLERIWNLSLSQRTLILDTIGEDTIKTVLSWVVITRIVIAHVYTFTYVTNIYPIITWSRPNLLLPWLILSFFKNVVLEVIVIVIGLLIWYETQFSVIVFLEFILVKLVPLVLACYNWYSNSCLFLRLRYMEKMRKLRRTMRSDSNLMSSRLCAKMEDTKYRTKSLTTLLSCESYETYDSRDTISRILENPNLTPAQKTMKILGLTEKHVEDARLRIKDREGNRRLTESSDTSIYNNRKEVNLYMMLESEYEISNVIKTTEEKVEENLGGNLGENLGEDSSSAKTVPSPKKESSAKVLEVEEKSPQEATAQNADRRVSRKKREGTEEFDTKRTKQMKLCPSCHVNDKACSHLLRRREPARLCGSRQTKKSVEKSCSPVKLQELFNCTCLSFDHPFARTAGNCCLIDDTAIRTSTPKKCCESKEIAENKEEAAENPEKAVEQDCVHSCNVTSVKDDFALAGASPLMESLLKNDLEILKSVAMTDQNSEKNILEDKAVQGLGASKPEESNLCTGMFSDYRSTLIDLQDLSSDPEEFEGKNATRSLDVVEETNSRKADRELSGTTSSKSTEGGACAIQNSLPLYSALGAKKNALKMGLPEYSFGSTSVPRFYKDSMTVFDGCYERDFDNNSELQCLLEQMNKKKWNLFPSEGGLKMLLAAAFSKEVDSIIEGIQNLKIEDPIKMDRYEVPVSKPLKSTSPIGKSQEVQADEPQRYVSRKPKNIPEPVSSPPPVKDVSTQTFEDFHPKSSFSSTIEAWKRKKRRRFKDQSASTVSVGSKRSVQSTNKVESCSSVSKDRSRSSIDIWHRVSSKASNKEPRRQPSLTKSQSDKSVCECKMQKLEAKHSVSSESRFERKDDSQKSKQKVESFGTIPLAQVARTTDVESMVFRRKPPVYPKKRKENPSQVTPKKIPNRNSPKAQESESKQSIDKQSYSSKMPRTKGRGKSSGEQETLEMRALRAYNEVTLLKDKRELEAKKKFPGRNPADPVVEHLKSRPQAKKEALNRARKDVPKKPQAPNEDHLNKENLLVDATTETDLSIFSTSKDVRLPLDASNARSFSVLNEKYPCPKLLSVNRVTERLLENFDRLRGSQAKQDTTKGKPAAEAADSRKQYTKYSKPKKLVHEENLSISSSKKLEGTQKGRELERTPAKEDVRDSAVASGRTVVVQVPGVGISRESASSEARKEPLTTIKSTADQKVVSSWSSSTVDQADEAALFNANLNIEQHMQALLEIEGSEDKKADKPEAASQPTIPSSGSIPTETRIEIPSGSEADSMQTVELARPSSARERRRPDLTEFTRSIDVSRIANGVVIANTNAQGKSRARDIVDDRTARLVHNAFSYKSMESLLDLPPDALAMEDILNDNQLQSNDDEFVCRPSNEAVDMFPEELPLISNQGNSLEQTILATIRDTQDASQPEGSCDLCIITIDHEDPSADPEAEDVQSFSSLEGAQAGVTSDIGDVLSSIVEVFRSLNIRGLDLHNLPAEKFEILQNLLYVDEGEPQNEGLEIDEVEEQEKVEEEEGESLKEEDDAMRFIKEDIFTNIKFPIVIDSFKLYPDVLTVSNDDPRQLSGGAQYGDLVGTSLLLSIEARKDEDEEAKTEEIGVEVFETSIGDMLPLKNHTLLDTLNDSDISSDGSLDFRLDPSDSEEDDYGNRRIVLNETFEIVKHEASSEEEIFEDRESIKNEEVIKKEESVVAEDTRSESTKFEDVSDEENTVDEDLKTEEGIKIEGMKCEESMDDGKIEEVKIEGSTSNVKAEEVIKSIEEVIDMELGKIMKEVDKRSSHLSNEEYDDTIEVIKDVEEHPPSDTEANQEKNEIVNLDPEVSIIDAFIFGYIVFCFYIKYFYQRICSFAQVSRTTSTLKPFEIHTVSTSTSTLLETAELISKIEEEIPEEDEDSSIEESNADLKEANKSDLDENLRRTLSSMGISVLSNFTEVGEEDNVEDLMADTEELTLNSSAHDSEQSEASLLPTFDEESVTERYNYVLQTLKLKEGWTGSEDSSAGRDPQFRSFIAADTCSETNRSNSADEPEESAANESVFTFDSELEKLKKLLQPEKETETFQLNVVEDSRSEKSLLEDIQNLCEDLLHVAAKAETKEDALEPEGIRINDTQVESSILTSCEQENLQNESNAETTTSEKQASASEEGVSEEQNVEKTGSSIEQTGTVSSAPSNTISEEIDSFDSNYTRLSEASRNTVSVDLDVSSMEEFSIASNQDA